MILDPEGYPDDHSGLDAPGGASPATLAKYATYWAAMMQGWSAGIDVGRPVAERRGLRVPVRVPQLPARLDLNCRSSSPSPSAAAGRSRSPGRPGANVRGFISFDAACTPASTLADEATTLLNPPWGGQFNTLQFNAGRLLRAASDLGWAHE